jgi:alanine-synthesizing transaminase
MSSQYDFHRIKRLPPYVFAEVNAMKARARAAGEDIIDFGMGNPDQPTPAHIVDKLVEAARNPRAHRYSMSRGIPGLRKALSGYYGRRFGVEIDPEAECIVTLGSKEGLANLANAITSPGDIVLVPNPSYPIHPYGFIIAGGSCRFVPVAPDAEFLKALDRAVRHSVPKPIALVLNYPSNPTALLADLDFYGQVVEFCRHHGIWILSDLAYSEIYFDVAPPPSILQIPGAKDIAVEFTSMSKTYNMPGWRIGFAAGNKTLIAALGRIKSYLDYGAFTPIQVAATAALNGPQDCVDEIRALYQSRRDALIEGLAAAGWDVPSPPATMFAWAPIPKAFAHLGSLEFSKLLMREAQVAVAPGIGFGEYGDSHVRIGLVENVQRTRQAVRNIKTFLAGTGQVLEASEKQRAAGTEK